LKIPNNFSVQKAHKTQTLLAQKIITQDRLPKKIRSVAGVDVAYVGNLGIGAVSVVDYDSLLLLESEVAVCEVKMPYVPTLLSFRELPPTIKTVRKLKTCPDMFLVDAQGLAHPYRCGFACHLGLALETPTIGVAKSRLFGEPVKVGAETFLMDKGEVVGAEVRTGEGFKPVYVSVGHMVSLQTAIEIVKHLSKGRISEPLRQAHMLATKERNRLAATLGQK
jgi:deoxyribonuclease V